jgi:Asp-tRNA(Asn)/Glu-tRNA(Gln) amidotransferase A subunit family amidase
MEPREYVERDALGLADLVTRGDVSPAEVLEAALGAIDAHNPALNAVIARRDDAARAEVAAGLPDGRLRGVPYLIKDLNGHVAGLPTTNGVRLFADAVATRDSEFVARLRRAGAVIVGKTNTPGFGLSTSTEPPFFGACHNPWDLARSAGGSSGGAAAAVAGGVVPAAHATDGGGSIRIPSSCCGLFGLKPTRGRVTHAPFAGEAWNGMSMSHAVTRTVRDSAALLDVTSGPFPGDPYVAPPPARPYLEEIGADPGRLRIALLDRPPRDDIPVDPECLHALEDAARLCDSLGHQVEPAQWPELPPSAAVAAISAVHVANAVDQRLAELGRPQRDDDLDGFARDVCERGRAVTGEEYVQAVAAMHATGRAVAAFAEEYDMLCTPTMAVVPPMLGVIDPDQPFVDSLPMLMGMGCFTGIANLTGQPAMSVPRHRTAAGLPVGVQYIGRFGDESTLFRLASQLEAAAPWPQYAFA